MVISLKKKKISNTDAQTFRTLSQGLPNVPNLSFGAVDLTAAEVKLWRRCTHTFMKIHVRKEVHK
jgi:hypothetical protein